MPRAHDAATEAPHQRPRIGPAAEEIDGEDDDEDEHDRAAAAEAPRQASYAVPR